MDVFLIEFATPEYDEAVRLRYQVLREPLGLEYTAEQLAQEYDQLHLGAYLSSGRLAGYLNLTPRGEGRIQMRQVAVDPALQGRGIGKRLVESSEALARESGFHTLILHARETAVAFYLKQGYETEGAPFVEVGIPHLFMKKIFV